MSQNSEELLKTIKLLESELKKVKSAKRYWLVWEDKPEIFDEKAKNALPILQEDKSLRIEDSKDKPQNIIIEWDNYHSLSTLSYTHKGKIDVIYIDPPYNTWNKDFIYNDSFIDLEDSYRHSKWLSFMSKRLRLAKDLLTDDWVIFLSIDDNELFNLKLLCDEIFWANNFIENYCWQKTQTPPSLSNKSRNNIDYILCYEKNKNSNKYFWKSSTNSDAPLLNKGNWINTLIFPIWSIKFSINDGIYNKGTYGNIEINSDFNVKDWVNSTEVEMKWEFKWQQSNLEKELQHWSHLLIKSKKMSIRYQKSNERVSNMLPNKMIDTSFWVKTNEDASKQVKELWFDFSFPKPTSLISFLINMAKYDKKEIVILDFFAGSGTTGQAVMELNKEDWWKRQFILCSSCENSNEEPDKNICKDITYERNKRVIEWYKNSKWEDIEGLGGNLRYYTTEFIKADKSIDDLRYSFIDMCDDLLCIKENTFSEVTLKDWKPELKLFKSWNKYTAILYDIHYFTDLLKLLQVLDWKIAVYIFSLSKDIFEEEVEHLEKDIVIQNIPDDILETYNKIFNF